MNLRYSFRNTKYNNSIEYNILLEIQNIVILYNIGYNRIYNIYVKVIIKSQLYNNKFLIITNNTIVYEVT